MLLGLKFMGFGVTWDLEVVPLIICFVYMIILGLAHGMIATITSIYNYRGFIKFDGNLNF